MIAAVQSPTTADTILKKVEESENADDSEMENLSERAEEAVREKLKKMDPKDFQRIVGAIFKATGFTELYNSAGAGSQRRNRHHSFQESSWSGRANHRPSQAFKRPCIGGTA